MTGRGSDQRPALGDAVGLFGVVFLAYFLGAVLAWKSFGSAVGPAFFYPSAGVTAATMMLTARTRWPAVIVAIVVGEVLVDLYFGNTGTVAAGYAVANVVEPVVGAALTVAWCRGTPDLRARRDLVAFFAGACAIGPVFGGLIGGSVTALHGGTGWASAVVQWWAGDSIGVLVAATPILLWAKQYPVVRARPLETASVLVLAAVVSVAGFWSQAQPTMLILPILAWAAFRLDMLGAALAGTVVAFVATTMTSRGRGVFSEMDLSPASQLAVTQLFVGILLTVSLLVAQEAATRLQAVRDRDTERRERLRLETLSDLAQQLSVALTPAEMGRELKAHVLTDAGATALSLGLVSRDGRRLEWVTMAGYPVPLIEAYSAGLPLDTHTLAADTVRLGRPILLRSRGEYERRYPATAHWLDVTGAQTLACWPLDAGGKPIGILQLMWAEPQPLDAAQLAYFSAVATMVGQALVRARVYADEHARAAVLQSAVLPPVPGDADGLEVHVGYEPADAVQGVCGAWYDVMPLPGGRTYLAVGDVVGHGLPAVEDMAQLRSAARALAIQGLLPQRILSELNGFTRCVSQGGSATMAVAVFHARTGVLIYSVAGNPPPLLRRNTTGAVSRLSGSSGPALGPIPAAAYREGAVYLEPGDIVLLYTDGLVRQQSRDIDVGITQVERIVAGWDRDTPLMHDSTALYATVAPRPRVDDVCSIAVRVTR